MNNHTNDVVIIIGGRLAGLTAANFSTEGNLALSESLTIAFFHLLKKLSPVERAVFLLRELFEYEYAEMGKGNGRFYSILLLDIQNGRIQNIFNMLNPDKLAHLERANNKSA
jgi:hypothetical protein